MEDGGEGGGEERKPSQYSLARGKNSRTLLRALEKVTHSNGAQEKATHGIARARKSHALYYTYEETKIYPRSIKTELN